MKKMLLTILTVPVLALSACASAPVAAPVSGSAVSGSTAVAAVAAESTPPVAAVQTITTPATTTTEAEGASGVTPLDATYENAAPAEMQLLVGTLSLTGDLAVTQAQASTLLPLWDNLKTISLSMGPGPGAPGQNQAGAAAPSQGASGDAQAQIDTLVSQIQAAMRSDQIKAIAAMKITQDSAMAALQAQGLALSGSPPGAANGGQPPQGAPPEGAPGGSQPPRGGQASGGGQMAAPPAGGGMIPPEMFAAVIEALGGTPSTAAAAPSAAGGQGVSTSTAIDVSTVYTQTGGTETKAGGAYTATATDQSAIYVTGGGTLTLAGATITTSGDTSSADNSSFHGLNAAVLAAGGSTINLSDSTITTSGSGANGAFATEGGSTVTLNQVTIDATGDGGHAVMATNGGVMTLVDVDMTTAGPHSGAIATDRGGGTITATGGTVATSGQDSPGIYSTGDITVTGATVTATGAESAVIEGANSITLVDTDLSSSLAGKWGVMIYQSMSGDAEGTRGVFTMTGGSLANTATTGPLFYVNNSTGVITLKGVEVTAASGALVDASANSRWGASGSNGGHVILTADGQTLAGDLTADAISTLLVTLQNGSALTGAIDAADTAQEAALALDATSTWTVTADSHLTCLRDADGISGTTVANIVGNGHTVTYDASACSALGGATYTLSGGGALQPAG